jgi:hypothetical protein
MMDTKVSSVAESMNIKASYKIMGSNSYRGSLYGSDVDLFSNLKGSKEQAIWKFFKSLFKKKHTFLFMDFKAGLDDRLVFNEGDKVNKYLENPLIPQKTKTTILKAKGEEQDSMIRSLYVLRWTVADIIKGETTLIDGSKKSFVDALKDDSIIKLDVAIVINDLFVDLTEVYGYKSTSIPLKSVVVALEDDVQKYHRSNTMKSLKRLYSYLSLTKKKAKLQKQLVALFNSPLGYANKLMNDVLFFIDVCEKHTIGFDLVQTNAQMFKDKYFKIEWSNAKFLKKLNSLKPTTYLKVFKELAEDLRSGLNPRAKAEFEGMD